MRRSAPDLQTIAEAFTKYGATFLAVDQASLADNQPELIFHLPVGTTDDQWDAIRATLAAHGFADHGVGPVMVNGETMPLKIRHVLHSGLHCYSRVPVYIDPSVPGLDPVALDDGLENVRVFLERGGDPAPVATDTVALNDLVKDLAAAGAASVEAEQKVLRRETPRIELRVPITPAEGAPVIAPYDAVTIDERTYDLTYTLTLDGPTPMVRLPLYIADSIAGTDSVTIEEGMKEVRAVLSDITTES